jgi:hypothetical protein
MNIKGNRFLYQVLCAAFFGTCAYIVRAANLITPLGGVFILDLRDFFVTIGAAIGGPVVGLVIGICAGLPAKIQILDISSFATAGIVVGILANYLYRRGLNMAWAGLGMLAGYGVALLLSFILGLSNYVLYLVVRAAICTPLNIIILNNLFIAFPRLRTATREETETEEEN